MRTFPVISAWLVIVLCFPALPGRAIPLKLRPELIYQRVIEAIGIYKSVPLKMELKESRAGLDVSNPEKPQLLLDQRLIDLATSMGVKGEALLAFFIGHQSAFYYNNLRSKPAFFAAPDALLPKGAVADADRLGVIYAHLAGYPMVDDFVGYLDTLYQTYGKKKDGFYKERIGFAKKNRLELKRFFLVFETANYLTMTDTLVDQSHLYEYVIQSYNLSFGKNEWH